MRHMVFLAGGLAGLLAACSGGGTGSDSNGKVSTAEAVSKAASMPQPEAGLYRATITMIGIEVPGMGPNMAGHGGGMTTTSEYCLTAEDVAKGYEEMLKQGQDGSCSYEKFAVDGGKLDAVMLCETEQGAARMTMQGTTTPTSSEIDASMKMDLDGMGNGTMRFNAKHQRIGDCP